MLLENFHVEIPKDYVLYRIGCKNEDFEKKVRFNNEIRSVDEIVDCYIEKAKPLINAKAIYDFYNVKVEENKVVLLKNDLYQTEFRTNSLAKRMRDVSKAALFVVTIGLDIEEKSREFVNKDKMFDSFLYDAIGSETAEAATQALHKKILSDLKLSIKKIIRYSPGYNDWKLEDQKKIFGLLTPERIGVRLTGHYFMIPQKSVSGIIRLE